MKIYHEELCHHEGLCPSWMYEGKEFPRWPWFGAILNYWCIPWSWNSPSHHMTLTQSNWKRKNCELRHWIRSIVEEKLSSCATEAVNEEMGSMGQQNTINNSIDVMHLESLVDVLANLSWKLRVLKNMLDVVSLATVIIVLGWLLSGLLTPGLSLERSAWSRLVFKCHEASGKGWSGTSGICNGRLDRGNLAPNRCVTNGRASSGGAWLSK